LFNTNSLLLYKGRPARLVLAGDRLEIELEGGETVRVRPKDVEVLHPGPLRTLADLRPGPGDTAVPGDIHTAWEILAGERTSLPELAELAFGSFTPASAWAAYQAVAEGVYFETEGGTGHPEAIRARTLEEVARRKLERDLHEAGQRAWKVFLERTKHGTFDPADRDFLRETENLALGRSERSQVLRELGRAETRENAHALLLELGVWGPEVNPYPIRMGVPLDQLDLPIPPLPEEPRRDLTHLETFAIDDEGTDTPDDALSLDGERVWVHIADVAALVEPGSALDQEAQVRGLSLHLPEGTVHLFPRGLTEVLGLGLQEVSPALSFGFDLSEDGQVVGMEIVPSWVRVTRLTYAAAEILMENEPFATLEKKLSAVRERRRANGAVMIDFPEVRVEVENNQVTLRPLPPLRSRQLVEESMILTGAEAARFASENRLPVSYSQQEALVSGPLETSERPTTLSGMFALRKLLKRSRQTTSPGPHGGLGVPAYTQATSPLRRYLDLVVHQQLRAFLAGRPVLEEAAIVEALGAVEAISGDNRMAEFLSEKHWTLVFLLRNPDWRGEGILVDKRGASGTVIIPSLALETRVHLKHDLPLDSLVTLALTGVNLPVREAAFRLER
jgi:exoribonuclease II